MIYLSVINVTEYFLVKVNSCSTRKKITIKKMTIKKMTKKMKTIKKKTNHSNRRNQMKPSNRKRRKKLAQQVELRDHLHQMRTGILELNTQVNLRRKLMKKIMSQKTITKRQMVIVKRIHYGPAPQYVISI